MFTAERIALLGAKLDPAHIRSRKQSGRELSYIEGWHAIAEANRIFGFDGWRRETLEMRPVSEHARKLSSGRDGWSVSYIAKVRVTVGDIVREGIGSGHGIDADLGLAHESAAKEAETDAMKRALMTFGNPFGLALYDKTQANVGGAQSEALEAAIASARAFTTKAELRAWWKDSRAGLRDMLDHGEFNSLDTAVANHAKTLPENDMKEAAE